MDDTTREMAATAYDETVADSLARGMDAAASHQEGVTAAAMCLAAMTGIEDAAARAEIATLNLGKE